MAAISEQKKNYEMCQLCNKLFNLMKFKEHLMGKLTSNISELDDVPKLCSSCLIKPKKNRTFEMLR